MNWYEIMDLYLEIDKDVKSIVYVVNVLEESFSEESNMEQKCLCNLLLLSLSEVKNKLNNAIASYDELIIKNNTKNE